MKRFRKLNKTASTLVLATAVSLGAFTPYLASAQTADSGTKERIRLMSSALQARDNGDLQAAKKSLEDLIKITPNDPNVQRLLTQVNRDIERQNAGQPTVYGQAATVTDFDPKGVNAAPAPVAAASAAATEAAPAAEPAAVEAVVVEETVEEAAPAAPAAPTRRELLRAADAALDKNNADAANTIADQYESIYGSDRAVNSLRREILAVRNDPWLQNPEVLSPGFEAERNTIKSLLVKARAQMLYGDLEGSRSTLRDIETRDPNNAEAKALQVEIISQQSRSEWLDRKKTREEMLQEVSAAWQRPQVFDGTSSVGGPVASDGFIREKLGSIVIPSVDISNVPLSRAIETLSELSVIYDTQTADESKKGINMLAMISGGAPNPMVNLKMRHRSLDTLLDFLTQQAGFQWDVQNDTVVVQRSGETDGGYVETEFFPISRGTVIRITGAGGGNSGGGNTGGGNPFAQPAAGGGGGGSSAGETENSIKSFFERAGIPFQGTPNATLAYDNAQLIVTQTPRNLERMRTILRRYDQPKQVEIEARFIEVQQGNLDMLGFNWAVGTESGRFGARTSNRSLSDAFGINSQTSQMTIDGQTIPGNTTPQIPGTVDLGASSNVGFSTSTATGAFTGLTGLSGMAGAMGIIDGVQLAVAIDALSRETGSDLLSSPKVTVLSGVEAKIVVAQELRYPESYGEIQSEVGTSSSSGSGSGSAGVTITAGTPQDFTTRNVGVEMRVTPTVEENQNIHLDLEPQVTEFEGFIEYGGTSVAISGGRTVTVPSGFYQPIFSVRSVRTRVTVFDGATVVLGGLTREEVKTMNDKVPVLGDIPLLGRLFQSKGETRQKKNLLIFVTANLISPGGSPAQQNLNNLEANSLFQNPIIVTPGGGVNRTANTGAATSK